MATAMKLLDSHQPILQECMQAGGFTDYHNCKALLA